MPSHDDIVPLADRTCRELDAVYDFFEHSRFVWRSFKVLVDSGHAVTFQSLATGSTIDQNGLLRMEPDYAKYYLATFTFRQFVSIFEVFLFDLLRLVLLQNPWQLGKKQLEFSLVLNSRDREEIMGGVIARELNELKYERLRDWFEALHKAVGIRCPSEDEIEALSEVKAARDVLEHNAGVVNEVYLRKAGKMARYAAGERIEIDDNYHLESWRLIKKVVHDVAAAAAARLAPPTSPS
jgi:hypothetical protein